MTSYQVELDPAEEQMLQDLLSSGRFGDAGEALRAGLRLLTDDGGMGESMRSRFVRSLREVDPGWSPLGAKAGPKGIKGDTGRS